MALSVDVVTPSIDAVPGALSQGRVVVHNLASAEASFTLQVVGLGDSVAVPVDGPPTATVITVSVPGHSSRECTVPVQVPIDLATGQHAAAFQVTSSRPSDRPLLAPFTVSVESIDKLGLDVTPAPIRGGRSAGFVLGVSNGESTPISFTLDAEATDVKVRFKTPAFRLLPGEHATTRAKVKGPRHLLGETLQHNLIIAARGKAASTTITTPYIQKPVFARKLRAVVAGLAVIALWLAAIGGVALWLSNRNDDATDQEVAAGADDAALIQLIDANGDPLQNGPYTVLADGTIVDDDGNPVDGFSVDENGNVVDDDGNPINGVFVDPETNTLVDENGTPIGLPPEDGVPGSGDGVGDGGSGGSGGGDDGSGGAGGSGDGTGAQGSAVDGEEDPTAGSGLTVPTSTRLRGTIDAGGADLSDVTVRLSPLDLGTEPSPNATVIDDGSSASPEQTSATKIWSARFAPVELGLGSFRQTEPVAPLEVTPGVDGVWQFGGVQLRRTYELSFSKPGFDTKAYVISPPDDGSDVELDVELEPARGVIGGRVLDNGRPLGGVEVTISDGTLTFSTTSATDGDVGSFSFDSVSTPGVYTLVGTRSGYGTSVVQVPLDPGEERSDVVVDMEIGVGSISGSVVGENGVPLGGIPVTATSGEMTRTTTTLTSGNVGFYNIPGLDVPGTYTVTVDTTGYLPQTRRVPMSGSIGGVNFAMVNTTSTLSGVVSSEAGGGVEGASITLANDDLEFEVTSAATPQPGAFVVENLPAGNYTVTIDRFDHVSVTEFITVQPGVDPPPLLVTLPVRDLTVDAGTGSLVVEIIDPTGETPEERQLTGADIALVETRTGIKKYELLDSPSFTAEFPEVAVGTYTILVSGVDGYNDAAARQVSIGQSQERRTIELLAFGAATGRMVDSFTGEVITGYTVKFYEQDPDGGAEREIGLAEVNVPFTGDGEWQTLPQVLPAGIYRVEIVGANGYEEPTAQQLQPGLPPMQILILPSAAEATEIPTLLANRYPDIMGRVYEPRLLAGTQTEFDPIDDPDLEVEMSCGGDAVPVPVSDEFGTVGGDAFDSFFLTRQAVDANDLLGECELVFSAPGYVTQTVDVPKVVVSDGNTLSDRVINAALVKPVDTFGGRVFWVDDRNGNELPLGGVDITADAVTSLTPNLSGPLPPGQIPTTQTTTITSESNADGTWTLNGQIFEDARYTFTTDDFAPGSLDVVIDQNRTRTVTAVSGMNLTEVSPTSYDVELEPPFNGSVSGEVTILSTDTKRYDEVDLVGTDPFGNLANDAATDPSKCTTTDSGLCIVRTNGEFVVDNASAGTWTVDFGAPDNHVLFGSAPGSVSQLVGPGEAVDGFDTTYVELGTIDVTAIDADTSAPIVGGATLRLSGGGGSLDESFPAQATNVYSLEGILVDDVSPETVPESYELEVVIAGYDNTGAQVFIDGQPCTFECSSGAVAIPLDIFAGSKPQIEVRVPPYGSIVATTRGVTSSVGAPLADDPLQPAPAGDLEVKWKYVTQSGGDILGFDTDLVSVTPIGVDEFELRGPPGYYEISVEHPEYETTLVARPTDNCVDTGAGDPNQCQPASSENDVYRLQNAKDNDTTGQFTLRLRRSQIDLSIFDDDDYLNTVDDAEYTLTPADGGTPIGPFVLTGTNTVSRTDIVPGMWTLELRKWSDPVNRTGNLAYPVIVSFNVGRSSDTATAVSTIRAPLAPVGGSIIGDLRAENSVGAPVALPQIGIGRNFDEDEIEVNGTDLDNTFGGEADAPIDGNSSSSNTANSDVQTFSITGLATGIHTLTFDEPAGMEFTSNASNPAVDVDVTSAVDAKDVGEYEYLADDVPSVTATFQGANSAEVFPALRVWLVPPDPADPFGTTTDCGDTVDARYVDASPEVDGTVATAEFLLVPPALGNFLLCSSDDLHADFETTVQIPVSTTAIELDPTGPAIHYSPTATIARITGDLTKVNGTTSSAITSSDNATLSIAGASSGITTTDTSGTVACTSPPHASPAPSPCSQINPVTDDSYQIDVTTNTSTNASGSFDLRLFASGYDSANVPINVVAGRSYDFDIELTDQIRFNVDINNPTSGSGLSVRLSGSDGTTAVMSEVSPGSDDGQFTTSVTRGPAGLNYDIQVRDTTLNSNAWTTLESNVTVPDATTTVNKNYTITRTVIVDVSGHPNWNTDPTNVAPSNGATSKNVDNKGEAVFTSTDTSPIPSTATADAFSVLVSNPGSVRTRSVSVPAGYDVTLPVAVQGLLAVNGIVYAEGGSTGVDDATISATATGPSNITGSNTSGGGNYSLTGTNALRNNDTTGDPVTWTITADKVGEGTGSLQVEVDATSTGPLDPSDSTPLPNANITLAPNDITVNFTVYDDRGTAPAGSTPPSVPLSGATVAFNGTTDTTDANGQVSFTVPENIADLTYDVTGLGNFTDVIDGAVPAFTGNRDDRSIAVPMSVKTVSVAFVITADSPAGALDGASVSYGTFSSTTSGNTITFANVPVDTADTAFTVTGPTDYGDGSGNVLNSELQTASAGTGTHTENVPLLVDRVTITFTVTDNDGGGALNAATITYPTGSALTGSKTGNVTTYSNVPVNIGGSTGTDTTGWLAELAAYDDESGDITTSTLRSTFSGTGTINIDVGMDETP